MFRLSLLFIDLEIPELRDIYAVIEQQIAQNIRIVNAVFKHDNAHRFIINFVYFGSTLCKQALVKSIHQNYYRL